jgi:glutamine amidotransferase
MVTIINYGMGNLGSVANMIKKVGGECIITSDINEIKQSKKLILPGVGAFDAAVKTLKNQGLWDIIIEKALTEKATIMGICLGMQLLCKGSEEGDLEGFGFIDGYAKKFRFEDKNLKVPHMGWNTVKLNKKSNLFKGMEEQENRFYFVHSYRVDCYFKEDILTTTRYGEDEFVSSFEKENLLGCQFHPEKSHKFGMRLFRNFLNIDELAC